MCDLENSKFLSVFDKIVIFLILKLFLYFRYHSLAPMYYRGAQAAIVVYDIQNQDSFARAKTWVKELQRQVSIMNVNAKISPCLVFGFEQYRNIKCLKLLNISLSRCWK